jgi:hypothetical protein
MCKVRIYHALHWSRVDIRLHACAASALVWHLAHLCSHQLRCCCGCCVGVVQDQHGWPVWCARTLPGRGHEGLRDELLNEPAASPCRTHVAVATCVALLCKCLLPGRGHEGLRDELLIEPTASRDRTAPWHVVVATYAALLCAGTLPGRGHEGLPDELLNNKNGTSRLKASITRRWSSCH